jgi:hypothetical protein
MRNYLRRHVYIAKSYNFIDFQDGINVTPSSGLIGEAIPSVDECDSQVAVSYLVGQLSGEISAHVKIMNSSFNMNFDYEIVSTFNGLDTAPVISFTDADSVIIAFGAYFDSSDLAQVRVDEITKVNEYEGWFTSDSQLIHEDIGAGLSYAASNAFPGIASRPILDGYAVESFVVYRTFEDAITNVTNPTMALGNIRIADIISSGKYTRD